MSIVPATPDRVQTVPVPWGRHTHLSNPKSTAKRRTRRLFPAVQAHVPKPLKREDTLRAIAEDAVDPTSARLVWLVQGKAVVQPVTEFAVPDCYDLERVRRIGSHEGATSKVGWYPVNREGERLFLEAESRLELHWLRALDVEPGVTWFHTQPFVLFWPVGDCAIVRFPDIVALKHGAPLVVEVKPEVALNLYTRAMFALTGQSVGLAGVEFRHCGSVTKQSEVNHMAISGHREHNPNLTEHVGLVRSVRPGTVQHLLALCGHPGIGREVLFELRAASLVLFDMDQPIRGATRLEWQDA